jgi:hypothetical protein
LVYYHLYYGAPSDGSVSNGYDPGVGQYCIGHAMSSTSSAQSNYIDKGIAYCGTGGRWAIDPDILVDGSTSYIVFRDDMVGSLATCDMGISATTLDSNGQPVLASKRSMFSSLQVGWDNVYNDPNGCGTNKVVHVIENPSLFKAGDGHYYIFFAGNGFATVNYSTGIADCGTTLLENGSCLVLNDSQTVPYFGNSHSSLCTGTCTYVPGDDPSAAAMAIMRTHAGTAMSFWKINTGPESVKGAVLTHPGAWVLT